MDFKVVVPLETAESEINALLDQKNMMPKRRVALAEVIENVIEAITFGLVSVNEDGTITQKLVVPVGGLSELKYAARVEPSVIQMAIKRLGSESASSRQMVYLKAYTGELENTINKLEPVDRNTSDCIALFFQ